MRLLARLARTLAGTRRRRRRALPAPPADEAPQQEPPGHGPPSAERDGILLLGPGWRLLGLNPRARDLLSLPAAPNPVGQDARQHLPLLGTAGPIRDACARSLAERVPTEAEQRLPPPAGRHLVARAVPAEGGGIALFLSDVTRERAAAARLAEREGMLAALGEATPDPLHAKDRDGHLVYANPAMLALIGRRAEEVLCRTEADWMADAAEAAAIMATDRRIMAQGATETVEEAVFDARCGRTRRFQFTKTPLRDPATGAVIGLVAVGRDVTETRAAADALAEAKRRLEATLDTANLGAWHWHVPSGRVAFDARWAAMLGHAPEEVAPHVSAWERLVHPDDMARVTAVLTEHLEGRTPDYECEHRLRHRDGRWIWVHDRGRVVERDAEGRPVVATGTHLDITSRKEAEARLAASEAAVRQALATLQAVYDQAPIGLCVLDAELRWVRINGRLAEMNGFPPEAHIGKRVEELLPQLAPQALDMLRRVIARGEPLIGVEIRGETPAQPGVTRVWEEHFYPLRDTDGHTIGINVVCEEVTARRAAQAELERLNRRLEDRVREEVAAREEAQLRAAHAERVQALGQLAGGIAHDFNNMLQAVRGGATLIERRAATDAEAVRRFARMILDATERGAGITRRLLAFARRGELRAEPIDPATLLEEMREVLAHTLGSPIAVRVEIAPGLPALLADKGQLETVLVNLATNARDAMPEGGTLTLRATAEALRDPGARGDPPVPRPGRYIRLSVADTGSGMDAATRHRMFEPFFTTKPRDRGTGLGLSMAKGFAEQSGGALAIDSAPGEGTCVTLWLPLADEPAAPPGGATGLERSAAGPGQRRCVLVVDDEPTVRETLAIALDDAGFAVLTAADGAEALSVLDGGESVDALVTDLAMPGIGGLALIRAARERRPGLPSVLMTGYAGDGAQLAVGGALDGAFTLLRKPVPPGQLADRIEALLANPPDGPPR
jgi:PAS domain S-box-containing protein